LRFRKLTDWWISHWVMDLSNKQWKAQRYQTLRHNYTQTSRKTI